MTPTERLAVVDIGFCLPLKLLLNFSLFQYLITTFWKRRHEHRVRILLVVAFFGFAGLMPFALPSENLSRNLSSLSGVCTVLTFLLQITILTRDVGRRIKIRSIWVLMWIGEFLTVISMGILVTNVICIFSSTLIDLELVESMDTVAEKTSLAFIVGFRFYFLSMIKGYRKVLIDHKMEIVCYLLFLTHMWPFVALTDYTGWDWHHAEEAWMRVTVAACLSTTIRARMKSQTSKIAQSVGGPGQSHCDKATGGKKLSAEIEFGGIHGPAAIVPQPTNNKTKTRK